MNEDKVIEFEGQPIFESDRNLNPPYYVYPNDFIAFLSFIGNDFRYSNILTFLDKLKSQDQFEMRTTKSDIYDLISTFKRHSYIIMLTHAIFRFTDDGRQYSKERLERLKNLKPNAYNALEKEFLANKEDIFYSQDWWTYEDDHIKTTESKGSITYHYFKPPK